MNELRYGIIVMLLVSLLTTNQMVGFLVSRMYQLTDDIRAIRLVAGCELWDIVPLSQPRRTLILACPKPLHKKWYYEWGQVPR